MCCWKTGDPEPDAVAGGRHHPAGQKAASADLEPDQLGIRHPSATVGAWLTVTVLGALIGIPLLIFAKVAFVVAFVLAVTS